MMKKWKGNVRISSHKSTNFSFSSQENITTDEGQTTDIMMHSETSQRDSRAIQGRNDHTLLRRRYGRVGCLISCMKSRSAPSHQLPSQTEIFARCANPKSAVAISNPAIAHNVPGIRRQDDECNH